MRQAMVNTSYLRYVIHKNGDTVERLAEDMGLSRSALSAKMNNRTEFRHSEIIHIIRLYKMNRNEIYASFGGALL